MFLSSMTTRSLLFAIPLIFRKFVRHFDSDKLRAILAKELLCRMYLVNRHAVNYTAMLLAFCKDEDPREGLGKAFTLAMGVRVCTDTAEGERYVEELVEQKRRVREMKLSRDYLRVEANEVIRNERKPRHTLIYAITLRGRLVALPIEINEKF